MTHSLKFSPDLIPYQPPMLCSNFVRTTFCSGMGMGVPLFFSDIKNPLRVMGAWGSGAGFESNSFDFVLLDMFLFIIY